MTDLDRQVATEVMHQMVCSCTKPHIGWDAHECLKCGGVVDMAYSTDIAAAWMVVEKITDTHQILINHGPHVEIVDGSPLGSWHCGVMVGLGIWHHFYADTAPEAICLAALGAIKEMPNRAIITT